MKAPRMSIRTTIRKRARSRCEKCGRIVNEFGPDPHHGSRHHRHPRRWGGKNRLYNLVFLCVKCHREIHCDEDQAAEEGWILPVDTAAAPVLRWDGWALLHPDGTLEHMSERAGKALLSWVLERLYLEDLAQTS